ncbi:MAG: HAD hydrolase-like protein [Clostridiales bacterium]
MALIFFDFDGVLVDSLEVETKNFSESCYKVGVDVVNTSADMAKLSEGNFYQGLQALGVSKSKIDEIMVVYTETKKNPDFHVHAHAPMMDMLNKLTKEYPVYVITSNVSYTVERVLKENGVEGVREILGAEKEPSKITKIHKIAEQYPGEKTIFIGDTKGDMVESAEAGIDIRVGVTWGWQKPWVVASGNPDYIFDRFEDAISWFEGFMKSAK